MITKHGGFEPASIEDVLNNSINVPIDPHALGMGNTMLNTALQGVLWLHTLWSEMAKMTP